VGRRNYLIEGVSGTGKTSVCRELQRRGHHAVNGDTELAYQGDPVTGEPLPGASHENHLWHVDRVETLVADRSRPVTYLCGGSRNFSRFLHLFDGVFVLDVDVETLDRRLAARPEDEFGGTDEQRRFVTELHRTCRDTPSTGVLIDATAPLDEGVGEILRLSRPGSG
jgi:thymidylate kinase